MQIPICRNLRRPKLMDSGTLMPLGVGWKEFQKGAGKANQSLPVIRINSQADYCGFYSCCRAIIFPPVTAREHVADE